MAISGWMGVSREDWWRVEERRKHLGISVEGKGEGESRYSRLLGYTHIGGRQGGRTLPPTLTLRRSAAPTCPEAGGTGRPIGSSCRVSPLAMRNSYLRKEERGFGGKQGLGTVGSMENEGFGAAGY